MKKIIDNFIVEWNTIDGSRQYVVDNKFTCTQTLLHNTLLISQKYANAMWNVHGASICWRPISGTPRCGVITCTNFTKIGL